MSPNVRPTSRFPRTMHGNPGAMRSAPTPTPTTMMPSSTHPHAMLTASSNPCGPFTSPPSMSPRPPLRDQLPTTHIAPIHAALAYRPGFTLPLAYDAALDPSTAAPCMIDNHVTPGYLGQAALSFPTECLLLECPALGSTITVRAGAAHDARSPYINRIISLPPTSPSTGAQTPCRFASITVSNVLNAIHNKLHESLPADSFAALDNTTQWTVLSAAQARCEVHPEEREKGVKRMDLLVAAGTGTRVAGLSATKQSAQVWVLHFR